MIVFGIHNFSLFLVTGILLNLTPGPDTAYILGRSITQGRDAGVASALGIGVGSILHTCAAALGLSAILATSGFAFVAIKLLGGAYLIFLGIKMLLERGKHLSLPSNFRRRTDLAAFHQGILTNVLNPKVALFFLAFLILGFTFVTTGTICCLILAWFAATFTERLHTNQTIGQWLNRTVGALFVYLGARLAIAK
jgi:threonine/homoserine/homoserine lactone efflux protein